MAKTVGEIMNHEVFLLHGEELASPTMGYLLALGISGAPVVDARQEPIGVISWRDLVDAPADAKIADRMTSPVATVFETDAIEHAADVFAELGVHRLFVLGANGEVKGALSLVDVVRALRGWPVAHPAAFPHLDDHTGVTWTDDRPFDMSYADEAPDGPGVLALVDGAAGRAETIVWSESARNVRARLLELIESPDTGPTSLRRILSHPTTLRFRAAAIVDEKKRARIATKLRVKSSRASKARVLR